MRVLIVDDSALYRKILSEAASGLPEVETVTASNGEIALALGVLALDAARDRTVTLKALAWTLAAGLGTAAYIMCDARGVRASGNPWAYGFVVSITNAAAIATKNCAKP